MTTAADNRPRVLLAGAGHATVLGLIAVAAALLELRFGVGVIAALAVAFVAAVALRLRAYGFMLGVAVLVNLNGIPGLDVNPGGIAISRLQDMTALGILLVSLCVAVSGKVPRRSPLQRKLYLTSLCLAGWWLVTWARTGFFGGVPPILAARYARDFLFFALTLPMLCDVFVTYPRLRRQVLWTLGVGGAIFAVAQIAQSGSQISLDFILHPQLLSVVQGTSRVYSPMNMLMRPAFAVSIAAVILAPTSRLRRLAVAPALLFGTSILLQLTRAAYFGVAVGIVVAGSIWWFRRGNARVAARKQLILVPLFAVLLLGVGATVSATERHVLSSASTRALAGYSEANSNSGTVAVRVELTNEMRRILGQDWPVGVGFLHPSARPFPSLPAGSIRNGDLGVLNAVMLMGAIGAILIYLPLLLVLSSLLQPSFGPTRLDTEWLRLGFTIWIIAAIASSFTLLELFSFGGLELTALILAIAASVAVGPGPDRDGRETDLSATPPSGS